MNTLDKEQLHQLERLLIQTDEPREQRHGRARSAESRERPYNRDYNKRRTGAGDISVFAIVGIALAMFAVLNPNSTTIFTCSLLAVLTVALRQSFIDERETRERAACTRDSALGLAVGCLLVLVNFLGWHLPGKSPATAAVSPTVVTPTLVNDAFVAAVDERQFDRNLGRTVVGALTPGLSMEKSLITGHVDSQSLTSALYWSMRFKNTNNTQKEARARIQLPEGAVVSRVTLWINGVEQEAAFNSAERVQAAYQWIVNTNRDPLLVTETQPGEIFMQAFPVPAHGEMKVRIGITAPLQAVNRKDFKLNMPMVSASNFEQEKQTRLKLESDTTISSVLPSQIVGIENGAIVLTGDVEKDAQSQRTLSIHRATPFLSYAARATHTKPEAFITEKLEQREGKLKLVLDKTEQQPSTQVAFDFPSASRASTLWAAQEARQSIKFNDRHTAAILGNAYRIVTPVTGAIVMENFSDYQTTGLSRNQYSVVPAALKAPKRAQPAVVTRSAYERNNDGITDSHAAFFDGKTTNDSAFIQSAVMAPQLQGATNGTIGPQGSDAIVITGVNTAGTVRVNNLAKLEALLNFLANACQVLGTVFGAVLVIRTVKQDSPAGGKKRRYLLAAALFFAGLTAPTLINWLVTSVNDVGCGFY